MAENQLQTAIKFIYGVHIHVDHAAKGKLGLALQNMNQLSSYAQNRIEVPQPRNIIDRNLDLV